MVKDGKILVANTQSNEPVYLFPNKANRHGLIAGATGTGKTYTLKALAESFSDLGVPVFLADVKGDVAGLAAGGYPTTLWDLYGKKGIQIRTTITEMGPTLLSRILGLNDLQSDILTIVFKIADDSNLALIDIKDLKAMLNYVSENSKDFAAEYGKMSPQSIGAIQRAVVALELAGGETFFGEPALDIRDWFTTGQNGKGMIHILDSQSLINNGVLYSTFLLWMLSELFETLPEVGDLDKPKMVFFFDEAHLLFKDTPGALLDKIEQVVKLVRSKGIGVYFITQNPRDIPDGVLAQLGNKIQHALHAYTPSDQKAVKAAADSFRENPDFDTAEAIEALGIGEAIVSFLQEDGTPSIAERVKIIAPASTAGSLDDGARDNAIKSNVLYSKYANAVDPESAYELLARMGVEKAEAEAAAKEEAAAQKAQQKEEAAAAKAAEREATKEANRKKRAVKSVGTTVAGTVGREVGKTIGKQIGGKFGQTLGGNTGAQLFRGILNTLLK
ncbi:MAG: DUF853 domain-containing protein [Pseudobutyrivibrio sp.]|nr:DUF853 domain-containing protein [Pseudobutyrivibrio sp.]